METQKTEVKGLERKLDIIKMFIERGYISIAVNMIDHIKNPTVRKKAVALVSAAIIGSASLPAVVVHAATLPTTSSIGSSAQLNPDDPANYTKAFPDVVNTHWAKECIYKLAHAGFIKGYPDGTFGPNKTITRAEFVTMLIRPLSVTSCYDNSSFCDVANNYWAKVYIETARENGLLYDDGTGKFNPEVPITREYVAYMIGKAIEMSSLPKQSTEVIEFSDANLINKDFYNAVATTVGYGIVKGYPDGTFGPKKNITRAEAAKIMTMGFELIEDVELKMPIVGTAPYVPYVPPIDDSLYSEWIPVYSDVELECDGVTRKFISMATGRFIGQFPLTGNEPWDPWTNDKAETIYNEKGELMVLAESKADPTWGTLYRTKANLVYELEYLYYERHLLTNKINTTNTTNVDFQDEDSNESANVLILKNN